MSPVSVFKVIHQIPPGSGARADTVQQHHQRRFPITRLPVGLCPAVDIHTAARIGIVYPVGFIRNLTHSLATLFFRPLDLG